MALLPIFLYVFPFLVRQVFDFLTACQLIKKKLLFYSQYDVLLLPKQLRHKKFQRDVFPNMKSGSHVCISKVVDAYCGVPKTRPVLRKTFMSGRHHFTIEICGISHKMLTQFQWVLVSFISIRRFVLCFVVSCLFHWHWGKRLIAIAWFP